MIRKFRTLILALVALSALSAVASQSAMAGETYECPELPEGSTCYITVEQDATGGNQVTTITSGSSTCTKLHGVGQTVTPSHVLSFEPVKTQCTAFGFATAHVTNNNCLEEFTTPTEISGVPTQHTLHPAHLVATPGRICTITKTPTSFGVSVCTQTIEAQTPTGGHLIATNITPAKATERYITLATTVTGIHYKGTGSFCGNSETHSDGSLSGNRNVTCFKDEARTVPTACKIL